MLCREIYGALGRVWARAKMTALTREKIAITTPNDALRNYRTPIVDFVKMTLETLASYFR